ncbi:DUF434 domain-containing protein [Methanolobus halotolerans]|uniref:DUF434 domain-containing protein n=1 Tax=Methanolobus halotolerans TaxID=2052935 RepID=A0A4E0Q186_9EURY|nr:DUF434 domain-containing protein [Methanolobus halotolerans]TGC10732.1 DUF434 domain-containing protein [Methanolobus halotolerans]
MTDRRRNQEKELMEAAEDIRYLLGKGYPKNSTVRFVCNHHLLEEQQRSILSRNVLAPSIASSRRNKRLACNDLKGRHIVIDGYNVLITLESYLKDECMWKGDDGFIRDNRGVFNKHVNDETTYKAVDMMLTMLMTHEAGSITVLLDRQMSKSGELATFIRQRIDEGLLHGNVFTSGTVDYELKKATFDLIVATADSVIIDVVEHVVDIPACVLAAEESNKLYLHSLIPDNDHNTEGKREEW